MTLVAPVVPFHLISNFSFTHPSSFRKITHIPKCISTKTEFSAHGVGKCKQTATQYFVISNLHPPYERRIGKYVSHKDFFKCGLISFCNLTLGWRRQRGNHIILYQVGVRKGLKKLKFSFEMFTVANGWSTFKVVSTTSERILQWMKY